MRDHERLTTEPEERRAAPATPAVHPHQAMLALQRASGNAAIARTLRPAGRTLARQEDQDGPVEVENIGPAVTTEGIVSAHAATLSDHEARLASVQRGDRFSFDNWKSMNRYLNGLVSQNELKAPPLDIITGHD